MKQMIKPISAYALLIIALPLLALRPITQLLSLPYDALCDVYNFFAVCLLFIYFLCLYQQELSHQWRRLPKGRWIVQSLLGYVCLFLLSFILTLIFVGASPQVSQNQLSLESIRTPVITQLMPLILVLLGPVMEELLFRGMLIGKGKETFPLWLLCLLSVFLFTGLHLRSLSEIKSVIPYLSLSLVCTFFYVRKNFNLWYPIAIHIINNFFAQLIITFLP